MDRKAFAICAGLLCPVGALLTLGCHSQQGKPQVARAAKTHAPRQLAEDEPLWADDAAVVTTAAVSDRSELSSRRSRSHAEPTKLKFADPVPKAPVALAEAEPEEVDEELAEEEAVPEVDDEPTAESVEVADDATPLELDPADQRVDLPWAQNVPRTAEMNAVSARADARVQRGFGLAGRGALYSAKAEFVAALQLIAQANDAQQDTHIYSHGLTAGMIALKESADFARMNTSQPQIDLQRIISGHKTPILKQTPIDKLTALTAIQGYYNYAREQLAAAAAREPSGSMALYGLGKVAVASISSNQMLQLTCTAQAMSYYQAALLADPNNFRAANELGVLLAENGSLKPARELFIRSITLSAQPATWHNLAVVHHRLGEHQMAEHAMRQAQAGGITVNSAAPSVQWLGPQDFARTVSPADGLTPPSMPQPIASPATIDTSKPAATTAKRGLSDWLPKNPWR